MGADDPTGRWRGWLRLRNGDDAAQITQISEVHAARMRRLAPEFAAFHAAVLGAMIAAQQTR
jgi:hypothetical protein